MLLLQTWAVAGWHSLGFCFYLLKLNFIAMNTFYLGADGPKAGRCVKLGRLTNALARTTAHHAAHEGAQSCPKTACGMPAVSKARDSHSGAKKLMYGTITQDLYLFGPRATLTGVR